MRHTPAFVGSPKGRTGTDCEYFSTDVNACGSGIIQCTVDPRDIQLFGGASDSPTTRDLHVEHNQSTFQLRGEQFKLLQHADPTPSHDAMLMECQDDWDRSLLELGHQESSMQDDGDGPEVSSTLWDELLMVLSEDEFDQSGAPFAGALQQLEVVCSKPMQHRRSLRVSSVPSVAREVSPPHRQASPNLRSRSRVPLPEPRKMLRSGKYVS